MAKKAKAAKARTPRTPKEPQAPKVEAPVILDRVVVSTDIMITLLLQSGATAGLRIDLDQLGVASKPTTIGDSSGNAKLLDAARPPVLENDNTVLLFFDPPLTPGNYAFNLRFGYQDDAEPVTPSPLVDGKYDGIEGGPAIADNRPVDKKARKAKGKAKSKAKAKK